MGNTFCAKCVKQSLAANPNAFGTMTVEWINLLETGVPAVCPACGPVYAVAKLVKASQSFPIAFREAASAVCTVLLVFAGAKFLDELLGL